MLTKQNNQVQAAAAETVTATTAVTATVAVTTAAVASVAVEPQIKTACPIAKTSQKTYLKTELIQLLPTHPIDG